MIQDGPAVIDRSVHVAKLRTDLETSTYHAEQVGIPLSDIVLMLLQRADDICLLANDRGLDLTRVGAFFAGDGE